MKADVSYPPPNPIAKLLIPMTEIAKRNQVLSVYCFSDPGKKKGAFDYEIHAGEDRTTLEGLKGDPLASLHMLGLIEQINKNSIFLYPTAFARAKYERKGRFGKWLEKTTDQYRDIILAVTTALTILLWIMQILEIIHVFE